MSYINTVLFGIFPYVAVVALLLGSWIRFDREQYTWKTGSSQMLRSDIRGASNMFHVGVIFVLCGHAVGLLTPESVYHHFISSEAKQLVAMVSGGFFGVVCFIGLAMLLKRRMTDPRIRATSTRSDIAILWMLMIQLVLGLMTIVVSTGHMDGSVMVMLGTWAQSIVTLQPAEAAAAIAPVHILYKLHVLFGLTLVLVFPFTRLVHIISAPVWYLGRSYQIVRKKG